MKRIICLLLSLFMMLTVLTSCDIFSSTPEETETTTESVVTTPTASPEATTPAPVVTTTLKPESSTQEPVVETTPEETIPSEQTTPAQTTPVETTPAQTTPVETTPAVTTPVETTPTVTTPAVTTPAETTPAETTPAEPEINYGTLNAPVSVTYAHEVCANLANNESSANAFYVKGTVTQIGETGNYYKNVYFSDGTTEMLIYTINMSNGITGFSVGDTITAYGYIKNYNGTIEMATYNSSVYVYVVSVESNSGNQGDTSAHLYTDFTADEKTLLNNTVGLVIPFIPNDEYYVEEYTYESEVGINFYTFGNTQAEFDAYRALFSSYSFDGTDVDEYGDTWYFYSMGDVYVDMTFYYYEGAYVLDLYVYIENDNGGTGSDGEINYGTLNSSVTVTSAYNACANLASGESSAEAFYVKGTVTKIGQTGNYYKNVYFSDGTTEMLIYTINMSNGITGFSVGDTITACGYIKNYNGTIEMATYNSSVYVYVVAVETNSGNQGGGNQGGDTTGHSYTAFTSSEKTLFNNVVGVLIPFLANDEYYVEEYELTGEIGVNFYTFGNTQAEFDAYRALFSSYTFDGTDVDEYGDTWYFYSKGDVYVDMSFYYYDSAYVVDVYVYVSSEDSGNNGNGGNGGTTTDANVITNAGAGLPEGNNGIYDVDFTKGNYVQNVTDQGYYLDGCPTTGSPAVLVIPVEFNDITAASKGYSIANIEKIFSGSNTSYYSVHDYFYISSYGKLDLDITVLDSWFRPANNSSYYENATYDYYGDEVAIGDQLILDEALAYLSTIMDLSAFDSDNNGIIDAVVMVNTLDIGDDDFHWAYRYWNLYTDDDGYYYEYDSVSANDYVWIAYEFMFEEYDEYGDVNYDTTNPLNPYTFIHEFSHALGADDYYDTEYSEHPLGGYDMMDSMAGDHNPYTKFNYGWITTSKLVVTNSSVTVNLEAFAKNGDTIILANNWDESLGAYQEYYVIMYYTATKLNADDAGFFARDGILVYHINSALFAEDYDGETYYDVYNNNTSASSQYGTMDNLIEFVLSSEGNYTYVEGDTLPSTTDDFGNALGYTFTIDSLTEESATITFTKK